jgi:hypothetical protein
VIARRQYDACSVGLHFYTGAYGPARQLLNAFRIAEHVVKSTAARGVQPGGREVSVLGLQSPQRLHPAVTRIHIDNDRTGGSAGLEAHVIARPAGEHFRDSFRVRRRIIEPVESGRVLARIRARRPFRTGAHPFIVHGVDRI